MKNIFIDIETFAGDVKPSIDDIKAPANYKDEEKIKAYKENALESEWEKQALDSLKGKVVCIGVAIDDNEPVMFTDLKDEKDLVNTFHEYIITREENHDLQSCNWIAHNGNTFDFVWLFHRIKKYGLDNFLPEPRQSRFIDTMKLAGFTDYRAMLSLDNLCQFFGIGKKMNISKSVHEMVCLEMDKEISEYCKKDVELLRDLYYQLK